MTTRAHAFFGLTDAGKRTSYAVHVLETWIAATLRQKEHCVLCLSGGSTPRPVYDGLATLDTVEWSRVRLCLVDERCVPPTHSDSNALLLNTTLGRRVEHRHILVPNTALPPQACADDYEERLLTLLGSHAPDIAILGMGEDGHIASLFPPVSNEALQRMGAIHTVTKRFAVTDRVSMTLPLLQRTTNRLLLLAGDAKRKTWEECLGAQADEKRWPMHALFDERLTVIADWHA